MKKEIFAEACVDYIFDTESEDFDENPSTEHVYYCAMAYKFGEDYAKRELNSLLEYLKTGEGKV